MVQWLTELVSLPEIPGSVPTIYMAAHISSISRGSNTLLSPPRALETHVHRHT